MDKAKNSDFLKKAGKLFNDFNSAIADNSRLHKIVSSAVIAPVLAVGIMAGSSNVQAATPNADAPSVQQSGGMFGKLKAGVLNSKAAVESAGRSALTTAGAAGDKLKATIEPQSNAVVNASSTMAQKLSAASNKLKSSVGSNAVVQKISASTENIKATVENNAVVQKLDAATDKLKTSVESSAVAGKIKAGSAAATDAGASLVGGATSGATALGTWVSGKKDKIMQNETAPAVKEQAAETLNSAKSAFNSFFKSDGYAAAGANQKQGADVAAADKPAPRSGPRM